MKSYQIKFNDANSFEIELESLRNKYGSIPSTRFLFYITWSYDPRIDLPVVSECIERLFPDSIYYGNEVTASIVEGIHSYGLYVNCTIFEDKESSVRLLWIEQNTEYSSLDDLWAYCKTLDGLKGIELIPSTQDNEVLGIDDSKTDISSNILIFGGISINYQDLSLEAQVFAKGHPASKKGTAVILYFGRSLSITNNCIVGWKGLGRYMTVTRSGGKIIHEIDGQKPRNIYKKYLNIVDDDSSSTLVFPLMLEEDGVEYLRTPRGFYPDKTVAMIVPIREGSQVRIAYGDKNTILDSLYDKIDVIESFHPEIIKSFSCSARKWFWGDDDISRETIPLQEIAPTNGFYTGGEILRIGNKVRVMNSTLVLISFKEGEGQKKKVLTIKRRGDDSLLARITHFTGKIVQEQEEALKVANEERQRNAILHEIINSHKWSFTVNNKDEIVNAEFDRGLQELTDIDLSSSFYAWAEIIHPDDKAEALEMFKKTITDHSCKTPFDTTYRMMEKDGKFHWFHSAGRMVRDEYGNGEFFGIHIDISNQIEEQLKNQKRIEEALVMAQSANNAKSSFLFNMSHDIRTPMNAIKGFTTMAKKFSGDGEKVNEYLEKIDLAGQQLLLLINQVLEMSRIESGKIEFENKPVNLKERFESFITVISEQSKEKGIRFHCSMENVKHHHILVDEAKLSQITMNITGNAIKYTPEGGSIDFTLKETECDRKGYARFVITVADTGIGMSKEFLKVLFDPFTREKSSTVSHIQGTGLGMSIVKNLVDLIGGHIEVQSEQGKGSRFDVTLEMQIDDSEHTETQTDSLLQDKDLKGRKVLLVEDNELNREIARFILEEMGLAVDEAEDGDIAVHRIEGLVSKGEYNRYDFILMDIQMPVMDGYEATRAIRNILDAVDVHIPIIAMTANAFAEDRQNSLAAGMDAHLAKPIDVEKLHDTLIRFEK